MFAKWEMITIKLLQKMEIFISQQKIISKIIESFVDLHSFYYEASVKDNHKWNDMVITMHYKNKTCSVGIATCKKLRDCINFSDGGMGVLVNKS